MSNGAWALVVIAYAVVIAAVAIWGLAWLDRWQRRRRNHG